MCVCVCAVAGVQALSGKAVPADLLSRLRALAEAVSRSLERAGLHVAALEALLVASACSSSSSSSSGAAGPGQLQLGSNYSRLLAACLEDW